MIVVSLFAGFLLFFRQINTLSAIFNLAYKILVSHCRVYVPLSTTAIYVLVVRGYSSNGTPVVALATCFALVFFLFFSVNFIILIRQILFHGSKRNPV